VSDQAAETRYIKAARELRHLVFDHGFGLPGSVRVCGGYHVLEHLDVFGIDDLFVDFYLYQVHLAVYESFDYPASGAAFDYALGQLILGALGGLASPEALTLALKKKMSLLWSES